MIRLKRIYDPPSDDDGYRILVERLWPRGLSKDKARVDLWLKEVAPSPDLRKWYAHEVEKWAAFKERYWDELRRNPEGLEKLKRESQRDRVTFVYAAKDEQHNSALLLKEFLEK
ncbi:MAG: DUF488 domain-containing protein [Chloroflexota bacterium]|nr:MAG: DUF488 domain-containing protein [Chloroflexota bacterium]